MSVADCFTKSLHVMHHDKKIYLHRSFKIPYLYDYITQLCRAQASIICNHNNVTIRTTGQGKACHRKYKRLKLGGGQAYNESNVYTVVMTVNMYSLQHKLLYESGLQI